MTEQEIREKYPYLYETHLHTSDASACAQNNGAEMAVAAKEYGYTGIFVTDHNWGGNTCIDRDLPWEEFVHRFCEGYRKAWKKGQEIGLDVFFGYEAGFDATEYLTYGIDEAWMCAHPELRTADIPTHYKLIQEAGGICIHAHPFREEWYIPEIRLTPEWEDGVEGINATHSCSKSRSHNDPNYDDKAVAYANELGCPMTAGSDVHTTLMFGGGVAFPTKLESVQDYVNRIRSGADYVLTNGEKWFDKLGNPMIY